MDGDDIAYLKALDQWVIDVATWAAAQKASILDGGAHTDSGDGGPPPPPPHHN